MRIALIGLPGVGKSSIGRKLARLCDIPFIDSDQVLEARLGCPIAEFFAHMGEAAFRDVEEQVLDELSARPAPLVLATGGGAVLRPATRERLRTRMHVLYLQCPPEEIAARLRQRTATRPLLHGQDPLLRLQALLHERDALYRQTAHHVVPLHELTLARAVQRVRAALAAQCPAVRENN